MRILVLTSTFPRWAGDREPPFVLELCSRLAEAHELTVLAPHCRGAATEERLGGNLGVRRFRYAPEALESLAYEGGIPEKLRRARWRLLLVPFFVLGEWCATVRAIRRLRPDVVHAHWIVPQGVAAATALWLARGQRTALVCTSHGSDLLSFRGAAASWLKRLALRRSRFLTVVSAAMKAEALALGASEADVRVMPMGVDARQRFSPDDSAERSPSEVLFVGRLTGEKGLRHLLDAFHLVHQSLPAASLTIVGAGPLDAELRSQARALGVEASVVFAGPIENRELPAWYRRAALLVLSSEREGFGLVLAEALACECPVVASDVPGVTDLVEDGVTGVLARPGDAADFAQRILRLLRDRPLASRLARAGRTRVLERYDWESVARSYDELLRAAAGVPR